MAGMMRENETKLRKQRTEGVSRERVLGSQYWLVRVSGHVHLSREAVERVHAHRRDAAQDARGSRDLFLLFIGGASQAA